MVHCTREFISHIAGADVFMQMFQKFDIVCNHHAAGKKLIDEQLSVSML